MTVLARAASLAGYDDLARSVGVDPRRELQRVGIPLRLLADPDALINYESFLRLLDNTATKGSCPDFGLRLSQSQAQDITILGPLAVLIRHARTLAEAAGFASRYLFVHTTGNQFNLLPTPDDPAQSDLIFSLESVGRAPRGQGIELGLGITARVVRMLGRGAIRPRQALLPHARLGPASAYTSTFGCPMRFDSSFAALRFATTDMSRPLPAHDPMLLRLAQTYLDQNFPVGQERLADSVRKLVRQFLAVGQANQQNVASALSIHPRSLQRRLVDEGFRFCDIVDEVRQKVLVELLDRSSRPDLTQVSQILGYSEQAALCRSCRRWFQCSPSELHRRRHAARESRTA
jgi:AraC-like DNA-binding protein